MCGSDYDEEEHERKEEQEVQEEGKDEALVRLRNLGFFISPGSVSRLLGESDFDNMTHHNTTNTLLLSSFNFPYLPVLNWFSCTYHRLISPCICMLQTSLSSLPPSLNPYANATPFASMSSLSYGRLGGKIVEFVLVVIHAGTFGSKGFATSTGGL